MIPALCPCVSLASLLVCKIETQTKRDCKQDLSGILCGNYLGVVLKGLQIRPLEFPVPPGQSEFMYQASYGPVLTQSSIWAICAISSNLLCILVLHLGSKRLNHDLFLLKLNKNKRMDHGNNNYPT